MFLYLVPSNLQIFFKLYESYINNFIESTFNSRETKGLKNIFSLT